MIFTARCYSKRGICCHHVSVCLSVCVSVCVCGFWIGRNCGRKIGYWVRSIFFVDHWNSYQWLHFWITKDKLNVNGNDSFVIVTESISFINMKSSYDKDIPRNSIAVKRFSKKNLLTLLCWKHEFEVETLSNVIADFVTSQTNGSQCSCYENFRLSRNWKWY